MTEWRAAPSFPLYEASDEGEIRRAGRERPLVLWPIAAGSAYLKANLWVGGKQHTRSVNFLVCEAFHGQRPSGRHHAAHSDGDPGNNRPGNLSWKTPAENGVDKIGNGTMPIGSKNPAAILTEPQVAELRREYERLPRYPSGRVRPHEIEILAARYGIKRLTYLHDIVKSRRWGHL